MSTTMGARDAGKAAAQADYNAGRKYGATANPYSFVLQNNSHTWWNSGCVEGWRQAASGS